MFGTLVALLRRGEPVLGVIDQPITRERWLGVRGRPTTLNGAHPLPAHATVVRAIRVLGFTGRPTTLNGAPMLR